jgi:antitoxin (DNA-binding transcriptional repressor) of toxin-antitoxin stability system
MTAEAEKTVSATEFKAKCLELMDAMSVGRLRCVHITKRGKPFLSMSPSRASRPSERIFTVFEGTASWPAGLDLTEPVVDLGTIEAFHSGRGD